MTVAELEAKMSSHELVEWMALYKLESSEREHQQQVAKQRTKRAR